MLLPPKDTCRVLRSSVCVRERGLISEAHLHVSLCDQYSYICVRVCEYVSECWVRAEVVLTLYGYSSLSNAVLAVCMILVAVRVG